MHTRYAATRGAAPAPGSATWQVGIIPLLLQGLKGDGVRTDGSMPGPQTCAVRVMLLALSMLVAR